MVATDKLFAGSIPEIYDRLLVPLIFEPYARDLAEAVARTEPEEVLETAAGTGVLTRALAFQLPPALKLLRPISINPCLIMRPGNKHRGRVSVKIGLEVDTTQVILNPLHPAVLAMHRGHDCRNAPVQIHRAYLSTTSMLPVALPRCRRLGFVNTAPEEIAGPDGPSQLKVGVVSVTRELTRTNPAKRSDETQRLRSDDRFRRYSGTAYQWPIWWGEAKAKPAGSKSGS